MACETGYIIERVETNLIKFEGKGDPVPRRIAFGYQRLLIQIAGTDFLQPDNLQAVGAIRGIF